jgi:hypothetical protein
MAAIFMTAVTFFIISIFALVVLGAHSMLTFFESLWSAFPRYSHENDLNTNNFCREYALHLQKRPRYLS